MSRFWAAFFGVAGIAAVAFYASGPSMNWWFPGSAVSPLGREIDNLFYLILVITAVTFIAVQAVLVYILLRYADRPTAEAAQFTHGSHTLEVVWTIVPAGILLFISLYQIDVWMRARNYSTYNKQAREHPLAEVTARQFEWRIRYPAPGKVLQAKPQPDDLYTVNDLHVPFGKPAVIHLRSDDVLHSFYLPHLRIKQDAVPGQIIPVVFEADAAGIFEIVCAELCGWGHYKMRGQVHIQTDEEFAQYLQDLGQKQFDDGVTGRQPAPPQPAEQSTEGEE